MNNCTTFNSRLPQFPDEVVSALDRAFAVNTIDCTGIYCHECPMCMPERYIDKYYSTTCALLAIWHEQHKRSK